jgi:alkanesulfonate monooxygenase SsuD/methylene tetrahydromethanopterin reductase-like flavin-dependent oxidoreductase (luciferase family)
MQDVRIQPAPITPGGPPVIVAGRQPVAMRRAALRGDGWLPYMYSPRRYRESVQRITELAGDRDLAGFRWMVYVPTCVDDDADRARRTAATFLGGTYRQDFEGLVRGVGAAGTVDDVLERLRAYVDAGAREIILLPCDRRPGQLDRLLDEVAGPLRTL